MGEFRRKDDMHSGVIHKSKSSGFASWVNLDAQRLDLWSFDSGLQENGEWVAFPHRRFAFFEQKTGAAWMDRVERLLVGIKHKNVRHSSFLSFCPYGPPVARVMLTSSMFVEGLTCIALSLPFALFNHAPSRSKLVKHPDVLSFFPNVAPSASSVRD